MHALTYLIRTCSDLGYPSTATLIDDASCLVSSCAALQLLLLPAAELGPCAGLAASLIEPTRQRARSADVYELSTLRSHARSSLASSGPDSTVCFQITRNLETMHD